MAHLRGFRLVHCGRRRGGVVVAAAPAPGHAAAPRHHSGDAVLAAAATGGQSAAVAGTGGCWQTVVVYAHLLRGGLGAHDHGGDGDRRAGRLAALAQCLAHLSAVDRRHGHPHHGHGGAAHAGRGRQSAVPRRGGGADQGHQAHAAHHRDGQRHVERVPDHLDRLCTRLLGRRHETHGRADAHVHHDEPGGAVVT